MEKRYLFQPNNYWMTLQNAQKKPAGSTTTWLSLTKLNDFFSRALISVEVLGLDNIRIFMTVFALYIGRVPIASEESRPLMENLHRRDNPLSKPENHPNGRRVKSLTRSSYSSSQFSIVNVVWLCRLKKSSTQTYHIRSD